ncbi:uncharacterized protein METZ01_LOCUS260229, partial [marine metagenome]
MALHQFGEVAEEVIAVVGTGRGLGVTLNGEDGAFPMLKSFDTAV